MVTRHSMVFKILTSLCFKQKSTAQQNWGNVYMRESEKETRSFKGFWTQVFYRCSANKTTKSNQTNIFRQFIVMGRKWKEMGILALIMKLVSRKQLFSIYIWKVLFSRCTTSFQGLHPLCKGRLWCTQIEEIILELKNKCLVDFCLSSILKGLKFNITVENQSS